MRQPCRNAIITTVGERANRSVIAPPCYSLAVKAITIQIAMTVRSVMMRLMSFDPPFCNVGRKYAVRPTFPSMIWNLLMNGRCEVGRIAFFDPPCCIVGSENDAQSAIPCPPLEGGCLEEAGGLFFDLRRSATTAVKAITIQIAMTLQPAMRRLMSFDTQCCIVGSENDAQPTIP